jgi:hypothetical protein
MGYMEQDDFYPSMGEDDNTLVAKTGVGGKIYHAPPPLPLPQE